MRRTSTQSPRFDTKEQADMVAASMRANGQYAEVYKGFRHYRISLAPPAAAPAITAMPDKAPTLGEFRA